jgi:hypothetical protein
MSQQPMASWECHTCEVTGRSPEVEPRCWNCDGPVLVTARMSARSWPMVPLAVRPAERR